MKQLLQQSLEALESLAEYEHAAYERRKFWGDGNPHRWRRWRERAHEITVLMEALRKAIEAPEPERNFCARCGERNGGPEHIHTCTPPEPVCPSCQAPGLMYECIACGVGNYPKEAK